MLDQKSNKGDFTVEVERVAVGLSKVETDSKKVPLDIQDLDSFATEEEMKTEVRRALWNDQMNSEVKVLDSN